MSLRRNGKNPVSILAFSVESATVAEEKIKFKMPAAGRIVGVTLSSVTAPVGSVARADVNKIVNNAQVTIFTNQANRPTIAAAATHSTVTAPDVTNFVAGDMFTIDMDNVGSTTAATGVQILIAFTGRSHG